MLDYSVKVYDDSGELYAKGEINCTSIREGLYSASFTIIKDNFDFSLRPRELNILKINIQERFQNLKCEFKKK
ncbi:hypothetical protein RJG79_08280 [Mycoplasmatota bacterium WC44]